MESEVIFHLLVYIPAWNEYPLEDIGRKYAEGYEEGVKNIKSGKRKAISSLEEFQEKIAKPQLEAYSKFLNPAFVSRSGLTAEQLINKMRAKLSSKTAYENYIKDRPVEQIKGEIPRQTKNYVMKKVFGDWRQERPLRSDSGVPTSPIKSGGTGRLRREVNSASGTADDESALQIILACLVGNQKPLRPQDELKSAIGEPVQVILPERAGEFNPKFTTLLRQVLDIIYCADHAASVSREQNDRLNQLVNDYCCPELGPFSTGGASHLDLVLIKESVTPADSTKVLDVKYRINKSFDGEEKARTHRAECIEKKYHCPLNPADYIGNPDKPAYFDMFLDIQVSRK
jgi:hypothetical protein